MLSLPLHLSLTLHFLAKLRDSVEYGLVDRREGVPQSASNVDYSRIVEAAGVARDDQESKVSHGIIVLEEVRDSYKPTTWMEGFGVSTLLKHAIIAPEISYHPLMK